MAGEGHGALRCSRMLLGAGLHCWKVTVNTMVAAELLMYSQGYKGAASGSHWSLLQVMEGSVMVCEEECDGT